jgi:hypothetical protein
MVEKQIDKKLVAADFQPVLASDEREASAQLEQELGEVPGQCAFDVALLGVFSQGLEVEDVRIFQRFAGQVGLGRRQAFGKIRDRVAGTARKAASGDR